MDSNEFSKIRHHLDKTQKQLSQLLGVSLKAVQSFEQGWRNVSTHTERQLLLLLQLKTASRQDSRPCWVVRHCPVQIREKCPAWEFRAGRLCWFINGTICEGKIQENWPAKMNLCRQCEVFRSLIPLQSR